VKTRDEMDRQGAHVECYRDLLAAARALASEGEREP
jgi:hypothetical protein